MEVGTEISQKIRSAIKAKLIELGAYVDDELPDYIMVMVANKKSREQMISDLNLFLGKNTDAFAEWLHGLLGKLQTISVDANDAKDAKEKKKTDTKKVKEKKVKKAGKSEHSQGKKGKSSLLKSKKSESADAKNDKAELKSSNKTKTDKGSNERQVDVGDEGKETQLQESGEVEDVRQMLVTVAPTDELAAELETTEARIEQSQQNLAAQVIRPPSPDRDKDANASTRIQRKRSASPSNQRRVQSSSAPKKYKGLTSVVASVRKEEEEEEEYDPLCPAVGNVASVVKVTNRKSKIPPALQANSTSADQPSSEMDVVTEEAITTAVESLSSSPHEADCAMVRLDHTASMGRIRSALLEVLKESKRDDDDDIAAFCQSVASCLRKMNQRNVAIAKLRIQKILFDYQSSLQSGGNERWNLAAASISGASGLSNSNMQNSFKNSTPTTFGLQNSRNSSDSASSKPDNSLIVTSSSKTDRHSPYLSSHHHNENISRSSNSNERTNSSEIDSSSSQFNSIKSKSDSQQRQLQPSKSSLSVISNKNVDLIHTPTAPSSQTISLDSLHLKRRSELESTSLLSSSSSSGAKSSSSVLKFRPLLHNIQTGTSGGDGNNSTNHNNANSGTDSPNSLSAEQLKVLAKNLKITISNRAKSTDEDEDDDESDNSSEDETDSEEDDDEQEEKEGTDNVDSHRGKEGLTTEDVIMEDSREIQSVTKVVKSLAEVMGESQSCGTVAIDSQTTTSSTSKTGEDQPKSS